MKPLLEVFVTTWNEEKIIEDFINWYRQRVPDCLITVWDNESDDKTVEICKAMNCTTNTFSTRNQMDEKTLISIRNTAWKNSKAEYVCIVDADEWVDLDRCMLQDNLNLPEDNDEKWNICKCSGYEMFGEQGDKMDDLLYGVTSAGYCKPILFKKDEIANVSFAAGSHGANPVPQEGKQIKWKKGFPKLYHTKHRSFEYVIERHGLLAARRSQDSRAKGWNFHYGLPYEQHLDYYSNGMKNRIRVR